MRASLANSSSHMTSRIALALMLVSILVLPAFSSQQQHPGMPRGQKHESRREIDQLEEAWRDALLKGNTVAMEALLADDYMAITAAGTLQTKEQALANLRSGRTRITMLSVSDRKVRFYGTTALVNSVAQVQGTNINGDISGSFRYTRVYVKDPKGKWKIVSFEASKIRQPGEHK